MPFSKTTKLRTKAYWDNHFSQFLKPLIEKTNQLSASRSEAITGDILKQIITDLLTSPVVVADITDYNPNVLWELGVRQSFRHGTITIAQDGTRPPFDIISKSILYYKSKSHINAEFYSSFDKAIANCLRNPCVPDSNILEVLSGRGSLYEIININTVLRRLDSLVNECIWNDRLHNRIIEYLKKNKDVVFDDKVWITNRLRSSALELLLIEGYLEEDKAFYHKIRASFNAVITMNAMISNWYIQNQRVEIWFTRSIEKHLKQFSETKSAILDVRAKLREKYSYVLC